MRNELDQPSVGTNIRFYARTSRRGVDRYGIRPVGALGPLNQQPIFIVGCPRSGTTFTASALGRVTGFADLGEVKRLKAGIPGLYQAVQAGYEDAVIKKIRAIMSISQRVAMVARRRAIEQTPESTFLIPQIARAFPQAHFIHLVRDGRDVVSSLVERGWLAGNADERVTARFSRESVDDAGHPFGGYARFWVERGRELGFENAGEIRRCAWAWRRYVSVALESLSAIPADRVTTIRYEELATGPARVAERVAAELSSEESSAELMQALSAAHAHSVGKYADRLGDDGLREVIEEAGPTLEQLSYWNRA